MLVMGNYSAIVPCGHLLFKPCNARLFSISIALGARIRGRDIDKKGIVCYHVGREIFTLEIGLEKARIETCRVF